MMITPHDAMIRFGLGRRGDQPLPLDPAGWLAGQLRDQAAGSGTATDAAPLPDVVDGLVLLHEQRKLKLKEGGLIAPVFRAEAQAQEQLLLETDAPFLERLVLFWTNHFTVSLRQGDTRTLIGPFIREAIRPHVTGRFADMLLAVMRHPAMLLYLDNAGSIGPDSPAGRKLGRGLNENLARECLELHTMGAGSGYSQADVTSFAAILTGWSVARNPDELARSANGFLFRPHAHQPGDKTLLGRVLPEGEDGGVLALGLLASHPATRLHLARQLTRHFLADTPRLQDVAATAAVLHDSDGDLRAASLALVTLAGKAPPPPLGLRKFRAPLGFAVAALRSLDLPPEARPSLAAALNQMGQPLWNAPLPNGWPDRMGDWLAPEAMLRRVDWSYALAGHGGDRDPITVAQNALGPLLRPQTVSALRHAGARRDALTLLFASPEFQRC